jgi:hypothetical protein
MSKSQHNKRIPWNKGKGLPKEELNRRRYLRTKEYKKVQHRDFYQKYQRDYQKTLNGWYSVYKGNAKKRGLDFNLMKEEFALFLGKKCTYCGDVLTQIGIDRAYNEIGYTKENSVPCCSMCNFMKRHLPLNVFTEHCRKISNNYEPR